MPLETCIICGKPIAPLSFPISIKETNAIVWAICYPAGTRCDCKRCANCNKLRIDCKCKFNWS